MFDLYTTITDRIIKELESGEIPWQKPYHNVKTPGHSHTYTYHRSLSMAALPYHLPSDC
ncbi:MAG: DUF1738 domain-containing protein [Clostridia bacterium]|nr:DUF1738 domain-containing protein [Clostridia bacterium]